MVGVVIRRVEEGVEEVRIHKLEIRSMRIVGGRRGRILGLRRIVMRMVMMIGKGMNNMIMIGRVVLVLMVKVMIKIEVGEEIGIIMMIGVIVVKEIEIEIETEIEIMIEKILIKDTEVVNTVKRVVL
jgi:hypothetical protein